MSAILDLMHVHRYIGGSARVFVFTRLNFSPVTLEVWIPIRIVKHILITKLIAQMKVIRGMNLLCLMSP
jgi:hypothetical protein